MSSVVSGAFGYFGAKKQADAAKQGAQIQAGSAKQASDVSRQMFDTTRQDLTPYMDVGKANVNALADLMKPGGQLYKTQFSWEDLQNNLDPGYQFRLSQGLDALNKSAAARGGFFSGGTGAALQEYGQGLASNELANAYGRWMTGKNTLYDRLYNLAGMGENAASRVGTFGMNTAGNIGQNYLAAGNALAQGRNTGATAWGNYYRKLGEDLGGNVNQLLATLAMKGG